MTVRPTTRERLTALAAGFACRRVEKAVAKLLDRGERVRLDPAAPEVASLRRRLRRETEQIEAERAEASS